VWHPDELSLNSAAGGSGRAVSNSNQTTRPRRTDRFPTGQHRVKTSHRAGDSSALAVPSAPGGGPLVFVADFDSHDRPERQEPERTMAAAAAASTS